MRAVAPFHLEHMQFPPPKGHFSIHQPLWLSPAARPHSKANIALVYLSMAEQPQPLPSAHFTREPLKPAYQSTKAPKHQSSRSTHLQISPQTAGTYSPDYRPPSLWKSCNHHHAFLSLEIQTAMPDLDLSRETAGGGRGGVFPSMPAFEIRSEIGLVPQATPLCPFIRSIEHQSVSVLIGASIKRQPTFFRWISRRGLHEGDEGACCYASALSVQRKGWSGGCV